MPSGAKKRKAARRKMEKEAAHHHHHQQQQHSVAGVHSHRDDDLKHHDAEKYSDAEEVVSPASQEHPKNHHQEEVEKTEDRTNVQSSSDDNKSFGGLRDDNEATQAETGEERDIEIEQEPEPSDAELNSKNTTVEDSLPQKEANGRVLLQDRHKESLVQNETDSIPASDEASSKNQTVENVEPRKERNDGVLLQSLEEGTVQNETESKPDGDQFNSKNAIVENSANEELNKKNAILRKVESQKEANIGADQGSVAQIEADLKNMDIQEGKNVIAEPAVPLKESTDGDLLPSQNEESHVTDKKLVLVDNSQFVNSLEEVNSFPEGLTQLTNSTEFGHHHSSSLETKSMDKIEKIKLLDEKIYGNASVAADSNGKMKEAGGKEAILEERNGRTPPTCVDLGPNNKGNEAIVKRHETVATLDAKISAAHEIGENLTVSLNAPVTETANGADSANYVEHQKYPEVPKSSDCQPSLPAAPRVVQRTSWMNCCGLFELFAGSNS